jgi:hypothetical protein
MGNFLDAVEKGAKPFESYFISEKFKYANDEVFIIIILVNFF